MAKDKERSINPAQQQRKLEKAKALKKGKAEVQARRNEKLAHRNPERLQRQVDDLKALESSGDIKPREKQILADLERDLRAIRKARESLGDKAPQFGNRQPGRRESGHDGGSNILGKRRHDGERKPQYQSRQESSGSDTDESTRNIPMPRDTPPPIPHSHRRKYQNNKNANLEPLGEGRGSGGGGEQPNQPHSLPARPAFLPEPKTTYESAPQIRDLRKEAVARFVPSVVRRKQDAARGVGGQLVEPEEMDRLEAEGYLAPKTAAARMGNTPAAAAAAAAGASPALPPGKPAAIEADADAEVRALAEEEERFRRELQMEDEMSEGEGSGASHPVPRRYVQMEEVEDEDM